jgi:hypothetical protein
MLSSVVSYFTEDSKELETTLSIQNATQNTTPIGGNINNATYETIAEHVEEVTKKEQPEKKLKKYSHIIPKIHKKYETATQKVAELYANDATITEFITMFNSLDLYYIPRRDAIEMRTEFLSILARYAESNVHKRKACIVKDLQCVRALGFEKIKTFIQLFIMSLVSDDIIDRLV